MVLYECWRSVYPIRDSLMFLCLVIVTPVIQLDATIVTSPSNEVTASTQLPMKKDFVFGVLGTNMYGPDTTAITLNESAAAVQMAIHLHNHLMPNHNLKSIIGGDTKCSVNTGPLVSTTLYNQVDGFIGPTCNNVIGMTSTFANFWDKFVLTVGAQVVMSREEMNTLARFMPQYAFPYDETGTFGSLYEAVEDMFIHYGWVMQTAIVHQDWVGWSGKYNKLYFSIASSLFHKWEIKYADITDDHSTYFEAVSFFSGGATDDEESHDFSDLIEQLRLQTRIIVFSATQYHFHRFLMQMFEMAEQKKLVLSEFAIIHMESFHHVETDMERPWNDTNYTPEEQSHLYRIYRQVVTVRNNPLFDEEKSDEFRELWAKYCGLQEGCEANNPKWKSPYYLQYAAAIVDSIEVYLGAYNKSRGVYGPKELMKKYLANQSFDGYTGRIRFDAVMDRDASTSIYFTDDSQKKLSLLATYPQNFSREDPPAGNFAQEPHWLGGRPKNPPDCGWEGCSDPGHLQTIITVSTIAVSILLIFILVCSFLIYRKVKMEEEIMKMSWKIKHEELAFFPLNYDNTPSHSMNGGLNHVKTPRRKESLLFNVTGSSSGGKEKERARRTASLTERSCDSLIPREDGPSFVYPQYKGIKVAARVLGESVQFELTRKRLIDLKHLKDLNNDHVVKFLGATIEHPRYLVYENCPKGSLKEFLYSPSMKPDLSFRFSIMLDLARGLNYLYNNQVFHGKLTTSSCLLDMRFVCKIADFGLYDLRPLPTLDFENQDDEYFQRYLYVSPERLREPVGLHGGASEFIFMHRSDIYSLGIIFHEILFHQGPFYIKEPLSRSKIVKEVYKGGPSPLRPVFDEAAFSDEMATLDNVEQESMWNRFRVVKNVMTDCWAEHPSERTELSSTISKLKDLVPENIMENMLARMDMYAKTMEQLVDEKAKSVVVEKKRADDLLYSILPINIANQIMSGTPVEAEWFDDATIYFSDIVGFTALSGASTPTQVVTLLNELYTMFDKIIDDFDVYKVETIGDAYMVVSGIPVRNGTRHSYNIACMSLQLLEGVKRFVIPHRPQDKLKLRIGLHTGPACAGVVGTKMPRYCLFGDTVNTASRMESNGEPLRIHISSQCKESLESFDEFKIEYRGEIEMKGKGKQKTYWLNDRIVPSETVSLNNASSHRKQRKMTTPGSAPPKLVHLDTSLNRSTDDCSTPLTPGSGKSISPLTVSNPNNNYDGLNPGSKGAKSSFLSKPLQKIKRLSTADNPLSMKREQSVDHSSEKDQSQDNAHGDSIC